MTAQELIKKYDIILKTTWTGRGFEPTGTLMVREGAACQRAGDLEAVKVAKPEILAILMEERKAVDRARKEREEKINNIPGLKEIRAALKDLSNWQKEFQASFEGESGGGAGIREQPKYDLDAMYAKYPRAKAYLDASAYADAEHYAKATAGKKAVEAIINGEDYAQIISAMEAEWSEYTNGKIFD